MRDFTQLLQKMTIQEKVGQLTQYNANLFIQSQSGVTGPAAQLGLTPENLQVAGSVMNFCGAREMYAIQQHHMEHDRNHIPMLFMMDVIHGYRTIYPIPLALGCSFDIDLVERLTRMAAREATAGGVQGTFAPMVDYARDARWGRVMETCGEDPLLNARMGAAQVRAYRNGSVREKDSLAACVKHYAGYGGAEAGRDYNPVELSENALREFYLPSYKACVDAGVDMLMTSFNVLNGVPSVANSWLMQDVLRDEWGFDGVVISDYNAIEELIPHGVAADLKEAVKLAFENGCHIEMASAGYFHCVQELVEEGTITMQQLDAAVLKVLQLKDALGLFDDPYHGTDPEKEQAAYLTPENRALARRAAAESAVLLKNQGILPFQNDLREIAVIGPMADEHGILGFWSCYGKDAESVTVAQAVAAVPGANITTVRGCSNRWDDRDTSGFPEAIAAAKRADAVILCLGEPQNYSGEGNSRADIRLPGMQEELAKQVAAANGNTVAVTFSGRPLALTEPDAAVPAILHMWMPGTEGGNAVADLLFGKANPCGKLSMTFPREVGQCPIYYNHTMTGRPKTGPDEKHIPYCSNYIDCGNTPLYSFGHGLSYSKFVYESLKLSAPQMTAQECVFAEINVRNEGPVAGKETVMLYMRDLVASNARPVQQLIAFEKIFLQPGETKTITFRIEEPMLRFWNNRHAFVSEPGVFEISTGYADHLILTQTLTLR